MQEKLDALNLEESFDQPIVEDAPIQYDLEVGNSENYDNTALDAGQHNEDLQDLLTDKDFEDFLANGDFGEIADEFALIPDSDNYMEG